MPLWRSDFGRPVLADDGGEVAQDDAEPLGQFAVPGANAAARDADEPPLGKFDDPESGHPQAGVDAENAAFERNDGARGGQCGG